MPSNLNTRLEFSVFPETEAAANTRWNFHSGGGGGGGGGGSGGVGVVAGGALVVAVSTCPPVSTCLVEVPSGKTSTDARGNVNSPSTGCTNRIVSFVVSTILTF